VQWPPAPPVAPAAHESLKLGPAQADINYLDGGSRAARGPKGYPGQLVEITPVPSLSSSPGPQPRPQPAPMLNS
jgi:hypothetical protein